MTGKQTQVFLKCQSEAEVRESDASWEDTKKKCPNKHKYHYASDIENILKGKQLELKNLIEHIAKLTVRIEIPIDAPDENISVFGTGFIQRVRKSTKVGKVEDGSSHDEQWSQFGIMTISTVHHVLFPSKLKKDQKVNLDEATVWIGYDHDKSKYEAARAFTVVETDKDINTYDWCSFECTTEDLDLIDRLSDCISILEEEQLKAYSEFNKLKGIEDRDARKPQSEIADERADLILVEGDEKVTNFVVVVGHPHGGPKQVSFGKKKSKEILKQVREQQEWCCYYHDAETCSGSSGSPVFIFGQPLCGYGYWFGHAHNHSGRIREDSKVTSIGVDHIVTFKGKSN